jgi:hypothetical protein
MTENYLAIGIQEDFKQGWAGIPFNRVPHYWIEVKTRVATIGAHGLVQNWKSICGHAVATTDSRIRPLVCGNFPKCNLCLRKRAKARFA